MKYQGGKRVLGPKIASEIKFYRKPGQVYLEPFVGALGVMRHVDGERIGSDANQSVITLYQAMQMGWNPRQFISREEWLELKAKLDPLDPMTALAGCGCSYAGNWFSTYIPNHGSDGKARRHLLKKLAQCKDVVFHWRDYRSYNPDNMIIYCDPPYQSTMAYAGVDPFDHVEFWDTMRKWSARNTVLISEISAPDDFEPVKTFTARMNGNGRQRVEHLFRLKAS